MIPIPLLGEPCNRCGACCRHGGACLFRGWHGLPQAFEGVCELLLSLPDGRTECAFLRDCDSTDRRVRRLVDGKCDYGTPLNPGRQESGARSQEKTATS